MQQEILLGKLDDDTEQSLSKGVMDKAVFASLCSDAWGTHRSPVHLEFSELPAALFSSSDCSTLQSRPGASRLLGLFVAQESGELSIVVKEAWLFRYPLERIVPPLLGAHWARG